MWYSVLNCAAVFWPTLYSFVSFTLLYVGNVIGVLIIAMFLATYYSAVRWLVVENEADQMRQISELSTRNGIRLHAPSAWTTHTMLFCSCAPRTRRDVELTSVIQVTGIQIASIDLKNSKQITETALLHPVLHL